MYLQKYLGFTLIELILTILLTALIAYNVIPKFFSTAIFRQNLFVQNATGALLYAQNLAIGSGCHISVTLTTTTITLNLRNSCTTGTFSSIVQDPSNIATSFVKTVPTGITLTSTNFPLYFDQNGQGRLVSSDNTTNATINVTGGSITTTINIKGNTGKIS